MKYDSIRNMTPRKSCEKVILLYFDSKKQGFIFYGYLKTMIYIVNLKKDCERGEKLQMPNSRKYIRIISYVIYC